MPWLSFDDRYTQQRVWDDLPYDTRWHFHAIVERCCAERRYDGKLRWTAALRSSDVPEPERCVKELIDAGLLRDLGAEIEVEQIEVFLPPEGERAENLLPRKRANQREYRRRKCERGEHDRHCPKECPVRVTKRVAGNPGSGRVGSGGETHHLQDSRDARAYAREDDVPDDVDPESGERLSDEVPADDAWDLGEYGGES